jgi:hypothetical protein
MTSPPSGHHPIFTGSTTNIMMKTIHCPYHLFSILFTSFFFLSSVSWSPSWGEQAIRFPPDRDAASIHRRFMKLALEQASLAAHVGEVPIGAILVHEDHSHDSPTTYRILARAGNRVETYFDASAHAELQVLRRGAKRLKNSEVAEYNSLLDIESHVPCVLLPVRHFVCQHSFMVLQT